MSIPPVTTQIVSVSRGTAGEQRARLNAVNVDTREAELHLLWGSLMLTLTSGVQAEHLRNVWLRAGVNARRLPTTVGGLRTVRGIDRPHRPAGADGEHPHRRRGAPGRPDAEPAPRLRHRRGGA